MTKEECEIETSKAIMEMRNRITELEKENARLKVDNAFLEKACEGAAMMHEHLTKAEDIIKDYMTVVTGSHITVCSVPEENRCIKVLKLNEQAEQFLKRCE